MTWILAARGASVQGPYSICAPFSAMGFELLWMVADRYSKAFEWGSSKDVFRYA